MILIRIDRASIKRNPEAGRTRTVVKGPWSASFTFEGILPDWIKDGVNCHIISQSLSTNGPKHYEGVFIRPSDVEAFTKVKGMQITQEQGSEVFDHRPLPKWLFKYDNPVIRCQECHTLVNNNDIKVDYDDDGNRYEQCPYCNEIDSFEERCYEDIEDVVNNVIPKSPNEKAPE